MFWAELLRAKILDIVVLARARVGAKSEEPGGAVVMLENVGLKKCYKTEKNKSAIARMN